MKSSISTKIGKIREAYIGFGGYQGAQYGFFVDVGNKDWSVGDMRGYWGPEVSSDRAKWTEEDRSKGYADCMRYVADLLVKAKVTKVSELIGKPVEVTFVGESLVSWRILEEAL